MNFHHFFKKTVGFFKSRKPALFIGLTLIILGSILVLGKVKSNNNQTKYNLSKVEKGSLVVSVSGSGVVSASNQLEIKPKVSSDVVSVKVKTGQTVGVGDLLVSLDARDAEKSLRTAEINYDRVKLEFEKMQGIVSAGGQIRGDKQKAEDNLKKAYDDGFNAVANTFLDLPSVMKGLQDVLLTNALEQNQWNIDYYANAAQIYNWQMKSFRDNLYNKFIIVRGVYEKNLSDYKLTSREAQDEKVEDLINETYETVVGVSDLLKDASNFIQLYQDESIKHSLTPKTLSDTHLSSLNSFISKINSDLASLTNYQNSIKSYKEAVLMADYDLKNKAVDVEQAKANLDEAKLKLSDYYIRAPFSGIIARLDVEKGDSVSSGSSLATLMTEKKIVELSLNEIDAAKVKLDQKATITFDAIPDLVLTGKVAEIDALGTVSQGVATYTVKIIFDADDDRVRSSMSSQVVITTNIGLDVLIVPASSVKQSGEQKYVEVVSKEDLNGFSSESSVSGVFLTQALERRTVSTGLSNDESVEVTSGLEEGDWVVRSIVANQNSVSGQNQNNLRAPGAGGFMRF